jgi:hypothetical protein
MKHTVTYIQWGSHMFENRKLLVLAMMLLFLVAGASAAKFVIHDKDASLSLAATPDHEVAFSVVIAENPDSYSASMSADDSSGASASQESNIGGADFIFSASAAVDPEGDTAYTATETYQGSTETTQTAHASQGNSVSVSQDTTSVAVAGASVSNATDAEGNTASQCIAFLMGINDVNLTADTSDSATASQSGLFAGLFAHTLGFAETTIGDTSYTHALIGAGGMAFDNTATASETTSASQDLIMGGLLGSAHAASIDHEGNFASQSVGFVDGILGAGQSTNTDATATASQSGLFAGLSAGSLGLAASSEGDISTTHAGVFLGGMTFDDTATAQDTNTTASQDVMLAGLLGSAHAGSIDQNGNIATQDAGFVAGVLNTDQTTDTLSSANAAQTGDFVGLGAMTNGFALSSEGDVSHTYAGVFTGGMTFDDTATAQDTNTTASQDVMLAGLLGSAHAGSIDQNGNIATQDAGFVAGVLNTDQTTDTLSSANAAQTGDFVGLGAMTNGFALSSEGDVSHTYAGVFTGGMTFDNMATAKDTNTTASQDVLLAGLLGSAHSGSIDQNGNIATQDAGFVAGVLNTDQTTDTLSSANAAQKGDFIGLGAMTNGLAISAEGDISHTYAGVFTGGMTFDDTATAQDTNTTASQDVMLAGLLGSAHAGSIDQNGNIATQDAGFVAGVLNTDQTTDTLSSANALQTGDFVGLGALTNGFALAANGDISHSHAGVLAGEMTFNNEATAQDTFTSSGQTVNISALAGFASVGSNDGINTTEEGSGIILGSLDVTQEATTSASAHAFQYGTMDALYGTTWGEATNGAQQSWTKADIVVGTMTFDNNATADGNTKAGQTLNMTALFGNASAGSNDGMGNVTNEGSGIIIGTQDLTQSVNTTGSAHAVQNGTMSAALGYTWGEATNGAQQSWTKADIVVGTMSFDNNATADGSTRAGQKLNMTALFGNASAGSNDGMGNVTNEGSGIIIGTQDLTQSVNTTGSAHAVQSGTMSAALGDTWGEATNGAQQSWTKADIVVGTMSFDNNATADGSTRAGQTLNMTALYGNASAGSNDGRGNVTSLGSGIILGTKTVTQEVNTSGSAHAVQSGTMDAALGYTWGEATNGAQQSWTKADIVVGTMTFDNNATADGNTKAGQKLNMTALFGNASAGSNDGLGNVTNEGSGIILGTKTVTQEVNTSGSAYAVQSGTMDALYGTTWGEATNGDQQSWTKAGVVLGTMTFDNYATSDTTTEAGQAVTIDGLLDIPIVGAIAGAGSTEAGSTDGTNTTSLGTEFILGSLENTQTTHTETGAGVSADQEGTIPFAVYGRIWGEAIDVDGARSWTNGTVIVSTMTFDTDAHAGSSTSATQDISMLGLSGIASAGSTDGTNSTEVGAEIVGSDFTGIITGLQNIDWTEIDLDDITTLIPEVIGNINAGYLDMNQQADTSASAHASQDGTVIALGEGRTWSTATSGPDEESWTAANMTTGIIILDSNNAAAGASTSADQDVLVFGLYGNSTAGSKDGASSTEVGAEILGGTLSLDSIGDLIEDPSNILGFIGDALLSGDIGSGSIDIEQQADTIASAHASQDGTVTAFADGRIWGEAKSGEINRSWTEAGVSAGVVPGTIKVNSNSVSAGPKTYAAQNLEISAPGATIFGSGGSGYARSGSTNEVNGNYAIVGAGFTNSNYNFGTLKVNQWTETDSLPGYAKANQTAQAGSSYYVGWPVYGWVPLTYVNTYWTKAEAGNNLGLNASIGTIGTPNGAGNANMRTETAGAVGATTRSYVSEQKTRLTGSSSTQAFANNTLGSTSSPVRTGAITYGYAYAEAVAREADII